MYQRGIVRASSITKSHLPQTSQSPPPQLQQVQHQQQQQQEERMTIAKFTTQHRKNFPVNFAVCKGYYGPNEDLKFSEGDRFCAHDIKQSTVINVEYESGVRDNVAANTPILFAVLFDPHGNTREALKGYRFEKISELVQLPVLPPMLWSRKAYKGSTPESSVTANELLIVKKVKARLVGRQQLKVYSHTHKQEKTLYTTCVGSFSTKPRDVALFLDDILRHMPDIFPCRAVMNPGGEGPPLSMSPSQQQQQQQMFQPQQPQQQRPCIVTLMHSSINTSLVISSALRGVTPAKKLEVPLDLSILVRLDRNSAPSSSSSSSRPSRREAIYEDLYSLPTAPSSSAVVQPRPSNSSEAVGNSQFYTNVHFGQECGREVILPHQQQQQAFASSEEAVEQGHYQTPTKMERTSSDPIPIEGGMPANYVLLGRSSASPSSGEGQGGGGNVREHNSASPSYRPPLPPPNKIKKEHVRSKEYSYVDTDLTRSTCVYQESHGVTRAQATENGENGPVLSTSYPDSAYSDKSFGSTGSGAGVINRRGSGNGKMMQRPTLGSGDGIVERSMRTSSISSAGYSYAKTNPPHPHHLPQQANGGPLSPHHYSHLRSRSGPSVLPNMIPTTASGTGGGALSQAQAPAQPAAAVPVHHYHRHHPAAVQRPVATTQLDGTDDSLGVVVQRQSSMPGLGGDSATAGDFKRRESMPGGLLNGGGREEDQAAGVPPVGPVTAATASAAPSGGDGTRPDSLAGVIDDLTKMTQELGMLEENIFTPDDISPTSPAVTPSQEASVPPTMAATVPPPSSLSSSSAAKSEGHALPPEVIEKHKLSLKSMDNYQVLRLLENMGLEQYTPTFCQEQINGDILSTCDDALLKDELKVTSRLHRMRLLRVIEGTYSVHEIMAGKDGYIFMASAGKQ